MPRPHVQGTPEATSFVPAASRKHYLVKRREELWFIDFDGEQFGPYQSEREAVLFAVDAAHQFSEQGEETQVLVIDENGDANPIWTYGLDPYPPRP